ncbi:GNAT family N-acetyltransferase [Paraburkholderia tropica]|uniref:RimJ/RimL family protein N-acetyltransferase n=1 Tax=Paraburkholderia tropica TaxID=92647 RepID=A0ABX5MVI1_9BURK|nr:GNAT family protein [Paraburkholderia tropica]MBB2980676.1 RimJ/RimL family protein N-acetyltransferase [Paraburkholderia tropica]MDE1140047.1 GNAT family protein [Paraburkholderia tropica]OBR48224.1 GCN5 family acetyltransferase [Paraburkholderia tropica]PXX17982.1 RimJ/RimL family protein N-acetyltransferase [Paraburkholderia tropica]PZW85964.1 RimJ/RimL family protein N-acetyltransferase [Paraburkholderia tropica]
MQIESPPVSGYPGISLRQLERADIDAWYAYLSLPHVVEHTSWNLHSQADLLPMFDAFESTATQSVRRLAMVSDDDAKLIGTIGFHTISDVNHTAEIAYDLAPSHWGKGIASAVCNAVAAWSFNAYGFIRVQGTVLSSNARSARVLQRARFRHEGLLRSYRMVRGTPGDFMLYARLATD